MLKALTSQYPNTLVEINIHRSKRNVAAIEARAIVSVWARIGPSFGYPLSECLQFVGKDPFALGDSVLRSKIKRLTRDV